MFLNLSSRLIRWKLNPPSISTEDLESKLTSQRDEVDDPICLLDVRDEVEYNVSHLAGAKLFPLNQEDVDDTIRQFVQEAHPVKKLKT